MTDGDSKLSALAPVMRTSEGLRDALFDELDALRDGSSNPQRAMAVSKLACQIINSVKMEIEYNSHVKSSATAGLDKTLPSPIILGVGARQ